jgi:rod shape-determining protein MreD
MGMVLAAVGAAVAALIQSSILPFTATDGAGLDLVLVLAVVWTMMVGFEGGLIWAFLGGLIIDVLLMRPMGLTAFVLLLAVGAAWLVGRISPRALYPIYPIVVVTVAIMAGFSSVLTTLLMGALRGLPPGFEPLAQAVPAALLAGLAAAAIAPLPVLIQRRRTGDETERVEW